MFILYILFVMYIFILEQFIHTHTHIYIYVKVANIVLSFIVCKRDSDFAIFTFCRHYFAILYRENVIY